MPQKHEDMSLDLDTHVKTWVQWHAPVPLVLGGGEEQLDPGAPGQQA